MQTVRVTLRLYLEHRSLAARPVTAKVFCATCIENIEVRQLVCCYDTNKSTCFGINYASFCIKHRKKVSPPAAVIFALDSGFDLGPRKRFLTVIFSFPLRKKHKQNNSMKFLLATFSNKIIIERHNIYF